MTPEQKIDAKAAIALYVCDPLERYDLFDGAADSVASRIRGLISLLPGVFGSTSEEDDQGRPGKNRNKMTREE